MADVAISFITHFFPHCNFLVIMLSEQDSHTIYLFDKLIGPDLAVLEGDHWVAIQGKIFLALQFSGASKQKKEIKVKHGDQEHISSLKHTTVFLNFF